MRIRNVILSSLVLTLAACAVDSLHMPVIGESPIGPVKAAVSLANCEQGGTYECKAPQELGGVEPILKILGANCPEACLPLEGMALSVTPDYSGNYDALTMRCSDSTLVTALSNSSCWDCQEGCGGSTCPDGGQCNTVTIPNRAGSDCQAYRCDVGAGWKYYTDGSFRAPLCRRPLLAPPATTAAIVDGRPYLSWGAVAGAVDYRVYRQTEWQGAPEVWYTTSATSYHDGSTFVSGPPQSGPPKGQWVRYHVVSRSAAGVESSYTSAHYYPYSGIVPY